MACDKYITITIDWMSVIEEIDRQKIKHKPDGIIAIRLQELEPRYIEVN